MKSLLRRRPSPAMVVALIALFVSLSGVSYGVATGFIDSREIKNNEVRSLDIRNNEIRTRDLRNNEVRGIDIRNSTIQGRDIALNTVTGEDVKEDTLQKVPSALLADTATSAPTAAERRRDDQLRERARRERRPVTLATNGPFTPRRVRAELPATSSQLSLETTEATRSRRRSDGPASFDSTRTSDASFAMVSTRRAVHVRSTCATSRRQRRAARPPRAIAIVTPMRAARPGCSFAGHLALARLDLDDDRQDHRAALRRS